MYSVDALDRARALPAIAAPHSPSPLIASSERELVVAYQIETTEAQNAALVRFASPYAILLGPPSDEGFAGHPLATRGLVPSGAFEVEHSSWIRTLAKMHAQKPRHRAEHFARYRHFVIAFHDAVLECIATGFSIELTEGEPVQLLARATQSLIE